VTNAAAPYLMTLASMTVLALATLLRWRVGKRSWARHPGGSRGYLRDVAVGMSSLLPLIVAAVILRFMIAGDPAAATDPRFLVILGVGYVGVIIARRLPPLANARRRIEDARTASYEAREKAA